MVGPGGRFLIYGASGYTGRLTAARAYDLGMTPILAGRDASRVERVARPLGFDYRSAGIDDRFTLDLLVREVDCVLNVAGPFSRTAGVLVEACLRNAVHYLDVTGELDVFADLYRRHDRAVDIGIMIMPGTGFAVVPSDCLAAHVSGRLPGATHLKIGLSSADFVSRGSARTMVELISDRVTVRREGELCRVPWGALEYGFDFGQGPRIATAMSWADVFTAYHTTGIPNVEVYTETEPWQGALYQYTSAFSWLLKTPPWQALLNFQTDYMPESPASPLPDRVIVAEARDAGRRRIMSRLRTPDGYRFTAITALAVVERVLAGEWHSGFQTPARVYGADFVLGLEGVQREDFGSDGTSGGAEPR